MKLKNFITLFLISLAACSDPQQSQQDKIRELNAKGEFIYRRSDEQFYTLPPSKHSVREKYPWEDSKSSWHSKINKEFFRCKGSSLNPPKTDERGNHLVDCGGPQKHSLPLKGDKEYIYPILIDLLNYVQNKTGKKVVITCGHRCPAHNSYADTTIYNQTSKHMIGAEVDFYVQGLESQPDTVVKLLMNYFKELPRTKGKKEFEEFLRYEKTDTNVSVPPWYNKEILIKLFQKIEGRDHDNRHPYPYLSLQVRFDRDQNERVAYSWPKANKGYKRY